MKRLPARALPRSQTIAITAAEAAQVSADNPLGAWVVFLAEHTNVSERSVRLYVAHLQRFAGWLQQRYQAGLLDVTTRDLREYRAQLAARQKPASVNSALAALRRFYAWATRAERIARNPALYLLSLATQPLAPKGFSDVERRRLIREAEAAGPMADAVVTTLLNTGLRVEELTSLTWERVLLQPRSGWVDIVGKGEKHRRVPLNAEARAALLAIRHETATGSVFRGKRGPYTTRGVRFLLVELGRRANVPNVYPHRFRHDTARQLIDKKVDLPTVAAWLGHKNLDMVRIYSQPDEAALERAAAAIEGR